MEHLAEVDARKLHVTAACSSLTAYCEERLGYSHWEAAHRVTAARLVQKYPIILTMLRTGRTCLSTLRTIAPVLTTANHRERLDAVAGRTRSQVEIMVAGWQPKHDVPTRIVAVKTDEPPPMLAMMETDQPRDPSMPSPASRPEPTSAPPSRPASLPKPLTPERFGLQVTIDAETYASLMKLRDHMRHTFPDGDIAKIITRAVNDLRATVEARKFGKLKRPKAESAHDSSVDEGVASPRAPGRAIRRAVGERDDHQCVYVSDDGHRCSSRAWLEHDHKLGVALNGPTWASNIQLLCHAHHRLKHRGEPGQLTSLPPQL